jgi:hypothetical protein
MAARSQAEREALHERIRAAVKADPAASARQIARRVGTTAPTVIRVRQRLAVAHGALRAPSCRCERAMPDVEGTCARCGRMVPIAVALVTANGRGVAHVAR